MTICSPQLGLSPKSILGGEVFDREILLGLAKRGVKVDIILPRNREHDSRIKNWRIKHLPIKHVPASLFNFLVIPYLFSTYSQHKFEILRLHSPMHIGFGAIFFKFFHPKVKIIATYHQFRETKIFGMGKILNPLWDHIICDSEKVKQKIIKNYKVSGSRITVVHNGVPSYSKPQVKDRKLIKKLGLNGKVVLLYMGLFIDRKNPLFLLDVLKERSLKTRNISIIFWGNGFLQSTIEERAKKFGLSDKVIIQKPLFGKEKNKIHNLADIFVHPAVDEGFPLAPLEAMACAKPVVITQGYSAGEMVKDGFNGFLCQSNNLNDWTNKLSKLIGESKMRRKMGENSRIRAKKEFQWKLAVDKHLEVLRNLTNESN